MNTTSAPTLSKTSGKLLIDVSSWLLTLRYYREEIMIFEHRTEQLLAGGTLNSERLKDLEQFQNQFIRHTEVIDEVRHEIKQHENTLQAQPTDRSIPIEHSIDIAHCELRNKMITFEKLYAELKAQFTSWLA